mgnify:CR=1 FL=1
MKGLLITVEGLDGSGKGTQSGLLLDSLREKGIPVRLVSFPDYDHPSSALVKMYLSGEFGSEPGDVNAYAASSFFAVDRYASYRKYWSAALLGGECVIADRYTTSNMVYQLTKLPRSEWENFLSWVCDFEYGKLALPQPDCTIYLDMPVEVSQRLLSHRYDGNEAKKDIHESNVAFLKACRETALYTADKKGWYILPCSDGEKPYTPEKINKELSALIYG